MALLEEAARQLYREWFVRLRFPGHEHTRITNGVPEGWERKRLGEVLDHHIGGGWGRPSRREARPRRADVFAARTFGGGSGQLGPGMRYHDPESPQRVLQAGDIIFEVSGGSATQAIGERLLDSRRSPSALAPRVICASFCKLFRASDPVLRLFLVRLLRHIRESGELSCSRSKVPATLQNFQYQAFLEERKSSCQRPCCSRIRYYPSHASSSAADVGDSEPQAPRRPRPVVATPDEGRDQHMKATEAKLLEFLKKSPQFVIPIYQRTYCWTEKECRQLWDDIMRTGRNDAVSAHFVGSIVYIEKGLYSGVEPVAAAGDRRPAAADHGDAAHRGAGAQRSARASRWMASPPRSCATTTCSTRWRDGERHYKLLLSQTDKASLTRYRRAAASSRRSTRSGSTQNFEFFEELSRRAARTTSPALCKGLAKLVIVDIALNRDQDNPQLIFESMNSTGRELSQADLIRNFILMGLEPQLQTQALRAVLAADGGGLRAGGLRHPLRRLHAPLPDGEDGRDPERARGLRGVQGTRPLARGRRRRAWRRWSRTSAPSPATTARWRWAASRTRTSKRPSTTCAS